MDASPPESAEKRRKLKNGGVSDKVVLLHVGGANFASSARTHKLFNTMDASPLESDAKRRKLNGGVSDKVLLDVGGVKFASSATTLISNSAYFAAHLSDSWRNDDDDGAISEIFIDQDPIPFRTLLSYMREGMIDARDIDKGVLLLADYLGVERLLTAVKARAYRNLKPLESTSMPGTSSEDDDASNSSFDSLLTPVPAPVLSSDDASRAFDNEYGSIRETLSNGILLRNIIQVPKPKKEFAIIKLDANHEGYRVDVDCVNGDDGLSGVHIIGSLNWLYYYGYTKHEMQLDTGITVTFSREMSLAGLDIESEIFASAPGSSSSMQADNKNLKKQFAMKMVNKTEPRIVLQIPRDDAGSPCETKYTQNSDWLEKQGYVDREEGMEELFRPWLSLVVTNQLDFFPLGEDSFKIFSRRIWQPVSV